MSSGSHIIVETKYGPVRGIKRISSMGDRFYGFQGIPYAKPPLNELRFRAPQEPEPWISVRGALKQSSPCFSSNPKTGEITGSEDCLHLNVYSKEIESKLPVMVWIHGGAFMMGSSEEEMYGPDYLMQKNVVFVSINYRLGAFGFLSIADEEFEIPGNAGLKDQTMALRWVQENIENFGGDPENVTIFGESAGGCSVHYHLVSDHSKDLFHKAILQSGTVLNGFATVSPANWAIRLARLMGWDDSDGMSGAVSFLQEAPAEDITQMQSQLITPQEKAISVLFPFGPVIEPYESENCFIPTTPIEMCRTAWGNEIPIIIGGTADEGLYGFLDAEENITNYGDGQNQVIVNLNETRGSERCLAAAETIKSLYFGDEEPSMEHIDDYIKLISDQYFWHGIHRTVLSRLAHASAPTYFYRFDVDGGAFNIIKTEIAGPDVEGVCHGDDIPYLFNNAVGIPLIYNSLQYNTIQRMVGMWVSFATTGDPNCEETKSIVEWLPVENEEAPNHCLNISDELTFIEFPDKVRMEVWDSLYEPDELV